MDFWLPALLQGTRNKAHSASQKGILTQDVPLVKLNVFTDICANMSVDDHIRQM